MLFLGKILCESRQIICLMLFQCGQEAQNNVMVKKLIKTKYFVYKKV